MKLLINCRKSLAIFFLCIFVCVFSVNAYAKYYPCNYDNVYVRLNSKEKVIALTFDDGPHPKKTGEILDVLKKYDVKGTFFMIGENVRLYPDVAKRVVDEGHEIGNHTYDHKGIYNLTDADIEREVNNCSEEIFNATGVRTSLFRPPEGFMNDKIALSMKKLGYNVILWRVDTYDWKGRSGGEIMKTVCSGASPGDIVLMHDYISVKSNTAKALDLIIPAMIDKGYSFVLVSQFI